jgi:hypothetical protein
MVSSRVGSFQKQAACPSSKTLLEYRFVALGLEISKLVEWHLEECDFCWAENKLLAHYVAPVREESRPPQIPVNLRLLAEALLINRPPSQA